MCCKKFKESATVVFTDLAGTLLDTVSDGLGTSIDLLKQFSSGHPFFLLDLFHNLGTNRITQEVVLKQNMSNIEEKSFLAPSNPAYGNYNAHVRFDVRGRAKIRLDIPGYSDIDRRPSMFIEPHRFLGSC